MLTKIKLNSNKKILKCLGYCKPCSLMEEPNFGQYWHMGSQLGPPITCVEETADGIGEWDLHAEPLV